MCGVMTDARAGFAEECEAWARDGGWRWVCTGLDVVLVLVLVEVVVRRCEEASRERIGGCLGSFLFGLALVWLWCAGWLVFSGALGYLFLLCGTVCVCVCVLGLVGVCKNDGFFFLYDCTE